MAGWSLRKEASSIILQQQEERHRTATEGVTAKMEEMSLDWEHPESVCGHRAGEAEDARKKKSG